MFDNIDEFADKSRGFLTEVQRLFDSYQNRFFTKRSGEFFCLELNGEAGELANLEKKKWKGKPIDDEALADESADVLIALMNYSNSRNIDLGGAVAKKLRKIEEKRLALAEKGENY